MSKDENEIIEQIYTYALELKESGKSDSQIQEALIESGLDEESSKGIIGNMNAAISEKAEEESSGFPSWLIWRLALIGLNVLSAIFDWPFWVY